MLLKGNDLWHEERDHSSRSRKHSAGLNGVLEWSFGRSIMAGVHYWSEDRALCKSSSKEYLTGIFFFTGIYQRNISPRRTPKKKKRASKLNDAAYEVKGMLWNFEVERRASNFLMSRNHWKHLIEIYKVIKHHLNGDLLCFCCSLVYNWQIWEWYPLIISVFKNI